MTDLTPQNIPFYWATLFFRKLVANKVHHVVISPGSRSTPLTMAAAANPHLQKQVILDERTAAFTALGMGKATGRPAVLVCTSGTATANYFPAVIEARQSGVPVILATADRPPHLRSTGANQAIDQLKLFGSYPVFFHEVGEPRLADEDLSRLAMLAQQAVGTAQQKRGPVHLNFPFRKPLEPEPSFVKETADKNSKEHPPDHKRFQHKNFFPLPEGTQQPIFSAQRPLIIVGPTAPVDDTGSITKLAEQLRCPVLSESTFSEKYGISGFAVFLRNREVLNQLEPDLILRFGFQPTAKSLEKALKAWQPDHHFHFASTTDWQDATYSESHPLPWLGQPLIFDDLPGSVEESWLSKWEKQEQLVEKHRQRSIKPAESLTDGHIYHHLLPQCSDNHFIAVSNSFPARDIQLFGGKAIAGHSLFLNRGASGIDGVTSTAMGISLGLQKPGILFTGDLAFLHDTNALLNRKMITQNLTVVVINNSGGSIFRMLPIEQHDEYFKDYFETPQSADIRQLVTSFGIAFRRLETLAEIQQFDLRQWQTQHEGLSVVECQTDADSSMELRKSCWDYSP